MAVTENVAVAPLAATCCQLRSDRDDRRGLDQQAHDGPRTRSDRREADRDRNPRLRRRSYAPRSCRPVRQRDAGETTAAVASPLANEVMQMPNATSLAALADRLTDGAVPEPVAVPSTSTAPEVFAPRSSQPTICVDDDADE